MQNAKDPDPSDPSADDPSSPEFAGDTDEVGERRLTHRHADDVDETAERSSGFDLGDHRDAVDEADAGDARRS